MADGSTIEWLQRPGTKPASWNPIIAWREITLPDGTKKRLRGWYCEHVHGGCVNCYAEDQNETGHWMGTKLPYKPGHRADVAIELHEPTLLQPLKWREPRTIFVCSMTDLCGAWVMDEWLDRIFAVAALCPQHTFIVLTKRPERLWFYLTFHQMDRAFRTIEAMRTMAPPNDGANYRLHQDRGALPNVWGLASCSTQEDVDAFVPEILRTPLAVRGVSAEPRLGPLDFSLVGYRPDGLRPWVNALTGSSGGPLPEHHRASGPHLDFVIDGGESGRDAREFDVDASRATEAQCVDAGVAFFRKQLGARPFERAPSAWPAGFPHGDGSLTLTPDGFGKYFARGFKHKKAGDPAEWPADLRRREFPHPRNEGASS